MLAPTRLVAKDGRNIELKQLVMLIIFALVLLVATEANSALYQGLSMVMVTLL